MITKRLSGLVAVALMLLLASCGKKAPSYTKYISKDANYVIGIDIRSVMEKLQKDSLSVENIMAAFKDEAEKEQYTKAVAMYQEFKDAGIDWSNRVYVAASIGNMMSGGGSFEAEMVAGMSDAKKFEDFLKKQPGTKEVKKGDGFSYVSQDDHTIGWNSDAVIVVTAQSKPSYEDYMPDSLGNMSKPQSADNAVASVDLLKKYFKLDKKASIAEAEGFSGLQSEKADIVVYSQTGNMLNNMPMLAMMPKLKTFLAGYATSTINFEDGKIVTEGKSHLSKEAADFAKKYSGAETDMSLIENYPSANIDGVMTLSFKPEAIPALVKEFGFEGPANMGLQQFGFTTDELGKLFKGDFAVVVSDFAVSRTDAGKDAMSASSEKTTVKTLFAAKLGDKAVVEKLLKMGVDKGIIVRNGNNIAPGPATGMSGAFPYAISIANDVLVVASDSATFNAYMAKSQKIQLPSGVDSKLKGKSMAIYIDAQKIMNGIDANLLDSSMSTERAMLDKAKATFKNGWYAIGGLSGSEVSSDGELNFMDDKKNSLSQIVRFGMFAYEQNKAKRAATAREWESMPADTATMVVPAPDTTSAE